MQRNSTDTQKSVVVYILTNVKKAMLTKKKHTLLVGGEIEMARYLTEFINYIFICMI